MKMFYRTENDEVTFGDLHYIESQDVGTGEPGMVLMFQPKPFASGKRFSLRNPVIKSIGVSRMHVECDGKTYLFYDDTAPWLVADYRVATWHKQPKNRNAEERLSIEREEELNNATLNDFHKIMGWPVDSEEESK